MEVVVPLQSNIVSTIFNIFEKDEDAEDFRFLIISIKQENLNYVKARLDTSKLDLNATDSAGWSCFHHACYFGRSTDIINFFLNDYENYRKFKVPHIDFNKKNIEGSIPFDLACKHGRFKCIELLINNLKIELNNQDNYGTGLQESLRTGFHYVCYDGDPEKINLFLNSKRNIDFNAKSTKKYLGYEPGTTAIDILLSKNGHILKKLNVFIKLSNKNRYFELQSNKIVTSI